MIDHTSLKKALKTLDSAPREVERAKEKYQKTLEDIRAEEAKGIWSPNNIRDRREKAKAERDRVIKGLTDSMKTALEVVKANNDYENTELNLDNPKLALAFNIINSTGKNLSYRQQVNLLNQFRGDPASLHVIEDAFKKHGLYFASLAHEMSKPISNEAIHDMEMVFAYADYDAGKGIIDLPMDKARWTKNQFAEQAQRLGYDISNESDPYEYALAEMKRKLENDYFFSESKEEKVIASAQSMAVDAAMSEITEAKKSGSDEADIFNKAIARIILSLIIM